MPRKGRSKPAGRYEITENLIPSQNIVDKSYTMNLCAQVETRSHDDIHNEYKDTKNANAFIHRGI